MKKINIAVACHKKSELPKNELFLPIHVGAELTNKKIINTVQDNSGNNISTKNPYYCELTAQYWEWKNIDADYYGLCHYRRFLCFKEGEYKLNERGQIVAQAINPYTIKKYGLDDANEMRNTIEQNDIVTGLQQDVRKLYTPIGRQKTAWSHWVAHNRSLIKIEDLTKMMNILREIAPEVYFSAKEYLDSPFFGGFNCFVMKKELFNEMCEIEFKVLKRMEDQIDLSTYNQQLTRIYGFMGEIISSCYIYHCEKSGKYKVKHVPLVYFNYTESLEEIAPIKKKECVPVIFFHDNDLPIMFATELESFLEQTEKERFYDIVVIIKDITSELKQIYMDMTLQYSNVNIRFIDYDYIRASLSEVIDKETHIIPYLPYILSQYEKVLFFDSHKLFKKSVGQLWDQGIGEGKIISSCIDVLMQARVNEINDEQEEYLKKQIHNPYQYYEIGSMIWNMKKYRDKFSIEDIGKKSRNDRGELRSPDELLNVLCENLFDELDLMWNVTYESNDYYKYLTTYMPLLSLKKLQIARKNPGVISYLAKDPWYVKINELYIPFWETTKRTILYERYISHMISVCTCGQDKKNQWIDKAIPNGSSLREKMNKMFPKKTKRYRVIKKILKCINLCS